MRPDRDRTKRCSGCDVELRDVYTTIRYGEFFVHFCYKCAELHGSTITKSEVEKKGAKPPPKKAKKRGDAIEKVKCQGCDKLFKRTKRQGWKKLCFSCWKRWKELNESLDIESQIAEDRDKRVFEDSAIPPWE